jgi:NitT/TauT family transport system substrate-binding protein
MTLARSSSSLAQEPRPETPRIRLHKYDGICIAPQYVADELLHAEGFTDIRREFVEPFASVRALGRGEVDLILQFAGELIKGMDEGEPITVLAGVLPGCFELFVHGAIRSIADLKGKRVGVKDMSTTPAMFLSSMIAYVGLSPAKDVKWVTTSSGTPKDLFAGGEIDAFLGFPPEPQELRARGIGRVIVNSALDRPWSQNFCCLLAGNRDFVRQNPVATKRALRAILKATDFCASDPVTVARRLVEGGFTTRYDHALQSMREIPYNKWRDYDPEDTIRFYSLRMRDAGLIKSTPNRLIAEATNWRFLNELKRELKG